MNQDRQFSESARPGRDLRLAMEMRLNRNSPAESTNNDSILNALALNVLTSKKIAKKNNANLKVSNNSCESQQVSPRCGDTPGNSKTNSIKILRRALYTLNNRQNTDLAQLLELLVQFDDIEGWRESGSRHCVAWMNHYLHIDSAIGWERLRVGRQLRNLPIIAALFRCGRLSWSKVRILTRIATPDNEQLLAHASLDASVSDVSRMCDDYRWNDSEKDDYQSDEKRFKNRSLTWRRLHNGNTAIRLELPPEQAQVVLLSIEQCEQMIYKSDTENIVDKVITNSTDQITSITTETITSKQRKADAVIMMSNRSLAYEREELPVSERYHVVLNVDVDSLTDNQIANADLPIVASEISERTMDFLASFDPAYATKPDIPRRSPVIEGVGPVSLATARKLTCDCLMTTLGTNAGEPLTIGRKTRIWPASMRTAIIARDRHCQFPGCDAHRHLQIHHIKHWADGGETSIVNGVCLCQRHHQLIHSGQFEIMRADSSKATAMSFSNSAAADFSSPADSDFSHTLFSSAKKNLLPTRCRFIVRALKPPGTVQKIESKVAEEQGLYMNSTNVRNLHHGLIHTLRDLSDSTRVDSTRVDSACVGFISAGYSRGNPERTDSSGAPFAGIQLGEQLIANSQQCRKTPYVQTTRDGANLRI